MANGTTPTAQEVADKFGGIVEEPYRVRIGDHCAILERGRWQIGVEVFASVEAMAFYLRTRGHPPKGA